MPKTDPRSSLAVVKKRAHRPGKTLPSKRNAEGTPTETPAEHVPFVSLKRLTTTEPKVKGERKNPTPMTITG